MTETLVTGRRIRKGGSDVYADLLPDGVRLVGFPAEGLLFSGELTAEQVTAIRDRMESVDDVDLAERAKIRAAVDGGATNLAQMLADRELGQPVREPIYPSSGTTTTTTPMVARKAAAKR